jgi:pimeloyl-ACP methyl ester carboxylesterase
MGNPGGMPGRNTRAAYAKGWHDVPIRYTVHGKGEPTLVCCNGLGVSTFFWNYTVRYFGAAHRVITWEYRGHYTSGTPRQVTADSLSMTSNAEDLAAVLDACKVERAVLLGHSMGCQVLLEFWRRHPDRVAGLVPICGPYGRPLDTFFLPPRLTQVLFEAIGALVTASPGALEAVLRPLLRSPIPDAIARLGLINSQLASREHMAPYFEHLARMDMQVFFLMALAMQRHDAGPWLKRINVPTLIVAGENDQLTPLSLSHRMCDDIRGAEMLLLPKGSHVGIIEYPELISLRLEKFLQQRVEPFLADRARRSAAARSRRQRSASQKASAGEPAPKLP